MIPPRAQFFRVAAASNSRSAHGANGRPARKRSILTRSSSRKRIDRTLSRACPVGFGPDFARVLVRVTAMP